MRYEDIARHIDHDIVCVGYVGAMVVIYEDAPIVNASIECLTCNEVIIDADKG